MGALHDKIGMGHAKVEEILIARAYRPLRDLQSRPGPIPPSTRGPSGLPYPTVSLREPLDARVNGDRKINAIGRKISIVIRFFFDRHREGGLVRLVGGFE